MAQITNDDEFRNALTQLDSVAQRVVAARFLEHVLPLSSDTRVQGVVQVAADANASAAALEEAARSAKAATFDSHTRCGSEGDWVEQAGYFVARAAVAAVTAAEKTSGGPAWQTAMSCRMAKTCEKIDSTEEYSYAEERDAQYGILNEYLSS